MENLSCPICGGSVIKLSGKAYRCNCCDSVFSPNEEKMRIRSTADIYKSSIESVLEINGITDGEELCGTGVIISPRGYVITNYHIVGKGLPEENGVKNFCDMIVAGRRPQEMLFRAEPIYIDPLADLALLYCKETTGTKPLALSRREVKTGEKICVIGNGKGEGLGIVDGIISDTQRKIGRRSLMMISAPVTMGYSGGPVFNSSGEFIGIVTGGREDAMAMNYAIPSETILKLLSDAKKANAGIEI